MITLLRCILTLTLPDNSLIPGDIWYDTSDDLGVVKYVWDGNQWIKDLVKVSRLLVHCGWLCNLLTLQKILMWSARLRTREDENGTLMQSDLNNETFSTLFNQRVGLA